VSESPQPARLDRHDRSDRADGKAPPFRPWSSTWVSYYDRASRRRHSLGGYKRLHAQLKRQRRAGKVAVTVAAIGMLVLLAVFYAILSTG
jgi:hypothetical protein